MTGRRIAVMSARALADVALWIYIANLRYQRDFYRRFLLDRGRVPDM